MVSRLSQKKRDAIMYASPSRCPLPAYVQSVYYAFELLLISPCTSRILHVVRRLSLNSWLKYQQREDQWRCRREVLPL